MSPLAAVAVLLLLALIACNALVTRRIHADGYLEPFQRHAQTAIVWLVPLLGGLLVWTLLHHPKGRTRTGEYDEGEDDDDDSGDASDSDPGPAPGHAVTDGASAH